VTRRIPAAGARHKHEKEEEVMFFLSRARTSSTEDRRFPEPMSASIIAGKTHKYQYGRTRFFGLSWIYSPATGDHKK